MFYILRTSVLGITPEWRDASLAGLLEAISVHAPAPTTTHILPETLPSEAPSCWLSRSQGFSGADESSPTCLRASCSSPVSTESVLSFEDFSKFVSNFLPLFFSSTSRNSFCI